MIFYENIIEQEFKGIINGVGLDNKEFFNSIIWVLEMLNDNLEFEEEFYSNKMLNELTTILYESVYKVWNKNWTLEDMEKELYIDFTNMFNLVEDKNYREVLNYTPYISLFNPFFDYFKSYLSLPRKLVLVEKRELKDLAFKAFAYDVDQKEREKVKNYKGDIMKYWLKNEYEGVPSINDFIRQLVNEYIIEEK